MLKGILKWIRQAGALRESGSKRNGFLSYSAEVHAVGHGLYDGMKSYRMRPKGLPDNKDVQAEKHYYKAAYVVGTLVQLLVVLSVAFFGL